MQSAFTIPISVKGIVLDNGKVWLRKNERNEWEFPGGKLDEGEQPEETIIRELKEELGFDVEVKNIIQAHLHKIKPSIDESSGVLVVSYLCKVLSNTGSFEINGEAGNATFKKFSFEEIENLNMPQFYKDAISKVVSLQ